MPMILSKNVPPRVNLASGVAFFSNLFQVITSDGMASVSETVKQAALGLPSCQDFSSESVEIFGYHNKHLCGWLPRSGSCDRGSSMRHSLGTYLTANTVDTCSSPLANRPAFLIIFLKILEIIKPTLMKTIKSPKVHFT